jgi:Arc/MetJ-type ribon-helix-helix transcriptional regulator
VTITIRLPAKLEADLRARLEWRRVALSDFVRDAIAEKLGRETEQASSAYELGKPLFGKYGSGGNHLSANRKTVLSEIFRAKRRH